MGVVRDHLRKMTRNRCKQVLLAKLTDSPVQDGSPKRMRVLDVGAGSCWLLSLLPTQHTRVGVDIAWRRRGVEESWVDPVGRASLEFVRGDATRTPFADNTFDLVYSNEFMSHVWDIDDALKEQMRVLKKGGVLIMMDGNFLNPAVVAEQLVVRTSKSSRLAGRRNAIQWLLHRDEPTPTFEDSRGVMRGYMDENVHSHYWWRKKLKSFSGEVRVEVRTFCTYLPFSWLGSIANNKVLVVGRRL